MSTNLRAEPDSFYRNQREYFTDDTRIIGLGTASQPYTRFGVGAIDFNNDGWLDLFVANGRVTRSTCALLAISRHLESSIWFSATTLYICALALIAGGLVTLVIFGLFAFIHAAHDIGDLISSAMPTFARVGLLAAVMLVPLALHQGLLGLALTLFSVGFIYGAARQRVVLCLAAIAVLVGAFPMARLAGTLLAAYVETPIEAAIFATDGFALPGEMRLLESEAERDPIAAMALAVAARRIPGRGATCNERMGSGHSRELGRTDARRATSACPCTHVGGI